MTNKIVGVFEKIGQFLKEVKQELKKVSWSTREEIKDATVIILISVAITATIIGLFDFIMSRLINIVIH